MYELGLLKSLLKLKTSHACDYDLKVGLISQVDLGRMNMFPEAREDIQDYSDMLSRMDYVYFLNDVGYRWSISRKLKEFVTSIKAISATKLTRQEHVIIHDSYFGILPLSVLGWSLKCFATRNSITYIRHILTPLGVNRLAIASLNELLKCKSLVLVASSDYIRRGIQALGFAISSQIIPPVIDTDVFNPKSFGSNTSSSFKEEAKFTSCPEDQYKQILYMGMLHPSRFPCKPLCSIIAGLHRDGIDVRLVLAIRNPDEDISRLREVKDEFRKHALDDKAIVYTRFLSENEKIQLYRRSDIVLATYRPPLDEPLVNPPLTLLEAMACGSVVATNPVLGLGNLIRHGVNGVMIDLWDQASLKRTEQLLENVLNDEGLKHRIGQQAVRFVKENYSTEALSRLLPDFYSTVAEPPLV